MNNAIVTKDNAYVGMKVVRGRDWNLKEKIYYKYDHFNDKPRWGIITKIKESKLGAYAFVKWRNGKEYDYRIGALDKYELYIAQLSSDDYSIF